VLFELAMSFIVIALDGGLLEGSVHPFELAVGLWMVGLSETMLDLVLAADTIEHVHPVAGLSGAECCRRTGCRYR